MNRALACVVGDLSIVRALGRRGIPVALAAPRGSTPSLSRYCRTLISTPSFVDEPDGAVDALIEWARAQTPKPVVFYQGDHDLLALSRHRDRLAPHLHCVLPRRRLVEDLVDKLRFAALAERLSLDVPRTQVLERNMNLGRVCETWEHFPCVLKPTLRLHWFGSELQARAAGTQKALRVENRAALRELLPLIEAHETSLVLQAAIEGGEDRIVSYHAYVRPSGEVVAEFTGRKVRTSPRRYGVSTCVEITDDARLKRLGRELMQRLEFSGVLKVDFKYDERDRKHYVLEVNPRYNLWHHPATLAGTCVPELVYNDCVDPGAPLPQPKFRPGVRWVTLRDDYHAFREYRAAGELSAMSWLFDLATAEVNEDFRFSDPLPGLAQLLGVAQRKLRRLLFFNRKGIE
jgi:predicted ATP-grasp superfamily ATP-dependent carboligase